MSLSNHPNTLSGGAGPTTGVLVTGTLTGLNGQTITGDANGAWAVTANGTNQNITLTPSGTGKHVLAGTSGILQFTGGAAGSIQDNGGTTRYQWTSTHTLLNDSAGTNIVQLRSGNALFGTGTNSSNGMIQLATHTTSAGGIGFGTDVGLYRTGAQELAVQGATAPQLFLVLNTTKAAMFDAQSTTAVRVGALVAGSSLILSSANATALTLDSSQNALFSTGSNAQALNVKHLTELTTIAAAATTDTTIQMPAGAIILSVSVRVTTVIPTAATFTVGDSGSAARFSTTTVSTAATSTDVGTKAGAYYNASALSVRITPNLTPADNTGRVRVTIAYLDVTVPTS